MSIYIGLDIGAASVQLVAIGDIGDSPALHKSVCGGSFFTKHFPESSPLSGHPLVLSDYRRLQGSPVQATLSLLKDFYSAVPETMIDGVRVTGSGGRLIARMFGAAFENEFRAVAMGMRTLHPEVRTIFEMGGEVSKYLRLEPAATSKYLGIKDYSTSGDCAAGTGSFIDQQASRLLYKVEEVGAAACQASCAARIAGRCSVFAKSDMIHAQQKGYTTDQILRGLCDAVARNFKSAIVKGRPVSAPVAFIGGVALNEGVVTAMREAFHLDDTQFFVPDLYAWVPALGAAVFESQERRRKSLKPLKDVGVSGILEPQECSERLTMENVILLRDRVENASMPATGVVEAYLGIDVGSVSTNLVVTGAAGNVLHEIYLRTQGRPIEVVDAGLREIEEQLGSRLDIRGVGTTGSGRELIGELVGADTVNDEITAHKTGACHVAQTLNTGMVDTIFEIGGQDSKFIRLENGIVVDFTMNEACAAGTGSFLEEQAEKLEINIKGEFAEHALKSGAPARMGERCTVFMERDVTALLLKGARVDDLCAGLAYSVALNYLNRVVRGRKIGNTIFFQGGTAYNDAVAAAFSQVLGKKIIVPPHNGVIGAIGMALIARDVMRVRKEPSKFRGYSLKRVNFTSREFVCKACSNFCDMKEFNIEGQRSYWGDKCSDKFRKRTRSDRQPVIPDLLDYRDKALVEALKPPTGNRPTVGVPRTMFFYDRFPFWCAYLQELGFDVITSPQTDRTISTMGEELCVAEPCLPVKVAHGHVQALFDLGVDYVLVPNALNAETSETTESHYCPWNQTLPFVIRTAGNLNGNARRLLIPTVHFRLGRDGVERELRKFARTLNVPARINARAVRAAYNAQSQFQRKLNVAGAAALRTLKKTSEPAIILIGRPYNLYDRAVNCDIPRKLQMQYGVNVVPMDCLPLDDIDVEDVNSNMYWHSGRRILAAAKLTYASANLHLLHISNFKCGPDSYIKPYLNRASGKPSLVLQFDGHSNDAGFMTRCEAYLESKGILRCVSAPTHM